MNDHGVSKQQLPYSPAAADVPAPSAVFNISELPVEGTRMPPQGVFLESRDELQVYCRLGVNRGLRLLQPETSQVRSEDRVAKTNKSKTVDFAARPREARKEEGKATKQAMPELIPASPWLAIDA